LHHHDTVIQLVHEFSYGVVRDGVSYRVQAWGEPRDDGLWEGWLLFVPNTGAPPFRTDRETTQSTLEALAYWATGLQPVYLEGALDRAIPGAEAA
jgi:hypothetical protein